MYVGRFAPSPTGPLHAGSLVAALASYLDARAAGGRWLLRIEDIDPPREQPGAADGIRRSLERLGLTWDGELTFQRDRVHAYRQALHQLWAAGAVFLCNCSRTDVAAAATATTLEGPRYPGTCRHRRGRPPAPAVEGAADDPGTGTASPAWDREGEALRLRVPAGEPEVRFADRLQGLQRCDPGREIGDFVLRRRDGLVAYQLAVVVDDHWQGVTHIVRGIDLLTSTFRQLLVARRLGLAVPQYAHVPIAVDQAGRKLSKQTGAAPIDTRPVNALLFDALQFLRQTPPASLRHEDGDSILAWGIRHWQPVNLVGCREIPAAIMRQ